MTSSTERPPRFYQKLVAGIGSRTLFRVLIVVFFLQATWLAFSFLYPSPYDEKFHLGIIEFYSHQYSPIITSQPPQYDYLRDLVHESSHFYHYLMSFPYRLVAAVTDNLSAQVIFLRIINVAMATAGLVLFSKLFHEVGFKQKFINLALLIFITIPVVPQLSGVINYDNMLLPLTALYLLLSVRLLRSRNADWRQYAALLSAGFLVSIVKYTFLPIFVASLVYILMFDKLKRPEGYYNKLLLSLKKAERKTLAAYGIVLLLLFGLFAQVYLQNIVRYGRPQPECQVTLSRERCLKSDIVARNLYTEETKDQRAVMSLPEYVNHWVTRMNTRIADVTIATTTSGERDYKAALPIFHAFTYFASITGVALLLYSWRTLNKNYIWYYLLLLALVLMAAVFADNYRVYKQMHFALAIQPRYLFSMLPVVLVMVVVAANHTLRRPRLKVIGLLTVLFMLSQGAGAITPILNSQDNWYWQHPTVIKANHVAKDILRPVVIE